MDQERWRRVEGLFHAALESGPEARQAFLDIACREDSDLREQVELLLAKDKEAGSFLETPALLDSSATQKASGSLLGRQFGPYRIESSLGAGGMGEVYRARDRRLNRDVAIKVLGEGLAKDQDRPSRFEREARTVAALNHPNIVTLFDIGTEGDILYTVSEVVNGESLRALLDRGPAPLREVIDMAVQLADGMAAAHAAGITHRDLKPENVMLARDGRVKILDFGLAKQRRPKADSATLDLTGEGVVMGTAGYMSPEQVRGEEVDQRSDLFSFGAILFEMLSGKRAFPGRASIEVMHAILKEEPGALPACVPEAIAAIVGHCLEKLPERRFQSASDLGYTLRLVIAARPSGQGAPRRLHRVLGLIKENKKAAIGSVVFGAALLVATWFFLPRSPQPSAEITERKLTFNSSENSVGSEEISPDGKYLAYSDPAGIHVRLLSTGEERLIRKPGGVPAGAHWLVDSWFPDGTQLVANTFEPGGQKSIWTVSMLGQSPRQLRENAWGLKVSPDGTHIAFRPLGTSDDHGRELWVMGIRGDNPYKVLTAGENEWLTSECWSPDGHRLAYIAVRRVLSSDTDLTSLETCDLKGANRTVVVPAGRDLSLVDFHWFPEGRIVYEWHDSAWSGSNLSQIAIDNAGTPNGKSKRITQWAARSFVAGLSASADGKRLVFRKRTQQFQTHLGELAAGGTRMKPPQRLTTNEASEWPTAWTADSKAVLFASNRNGTYGIYKYGISQGTSEPEPVITGLPDIPFFRLSTDGGWILFLEGQTTAANPGRSQRMMRIPASGGAPQFVLQTTDASDLVDFRCAPASASLRVISEMSPGKKQLIITAFDPVKGRGKVLRTIETDSPRPYVSGLSPDGSAVAVSHVEEPRIQIRLLSLSGGSDREITVKGWPFIMSIDWSPDAKGFHCVSHSPQGNTFLYVDLKGNAHMQWQTKGGGIDWSVPSPDGRYLAIMLDVENENVWMLEGF